MIQKEENKTLEFKENTKSLDRILKTIIAFANTAGGTMLIGIRDGTKEIVGVTNVLEDELKIANAIATTIRPLLSVDINISSYSHSPVTVYCKNEALFLA